LNNWLERARIIASQSKSNQWWFGLLDVFSALLIGSSDLAWRSKDTSFCFSGDFNLLPETGFDVVPGYL